jgi:hypothetical protein
VLLMLVLERKGSGVEGLRWASSELPRWDRGCGLGSPWFWRRGCRESFVDGRGASLGVFLWVDENAGSRIHVDDRERGGCSARSGSRSMDRRAWWTAR